MGVVPAIAALWGIAEATVFFIVPDVWISFVAARRDWKAGVLAACLACTGALIGGAIMYLWASRDAEAARHDPRHLAGDDLDDRL